MNSMGKIKGIITKVNKITVSVRLMEQPPLDIDKKYFKFSDIKVNQEVYYQIVEIDGKNFQVLTKV